MDHGHKPGRRWGSAGYIILVVIALLIAIFILRPLGQSLTNPFQAITNVLAGQQR